ncbi:MAG TPA: hypothetical protein VFV20_03755 [Candidatus Limnocylindria bacterium]|nr:hypothetical protein [Candidatus Limnocylindria bacterium]
MSKLVLATMDRIDHSESLQMALLTGASLVLGIVFLGLLIADEAHAAVF